ncbi:MAG: helix-turn-helix transcriptional regulator [Lachnospiraceae bacterium]|jgi:transcriptional regulator with XRE-family HTH domain|nr:helix-turn-helix transcriptional regulator [Lachnospiraceae bacterium]
MYERYCELRDKAGLKDAQVARETGITKSTFSDWKQGRSQPKREKLQKLADYFNVPVEYFTSDNSQDYYFDKDAAIIAQEVFENPELRILFDAARDVKPENIKLAAEMLRRFKEGNKDG